MSILGIELDRADLQHIAGHQRGDFDLFAVEERPVARIHIAHHEQVVPVADGAMNARGAVVVDGYGRFLAAPDGDGISIGAVYRFPRSSVKSPQSVP